MIGYPKTINSGVDLENCAAMVRAGNLDASDLLKTIDAVLASEYRIIPTLNISTDRKTVTCRQLAEAQSDMTMKHGGTISSVTHETSGEGMEAETITTLVLTQAVPSGATAIGIPENPSPFTQLGITKTALNALKEEFE